MNRQDVTLSPAEQDQVISALLTAVLHGVRFNKSALLPPPCPFDHPFLKRVYELGLTVGENASKGMYA